jgi:hypothetical protein
MSQDIEHLSFCKTPEMHTWIIRIVGLLIALAIVAVGFWLGYLPPQPEGIARLNWFFE